jgi:hypothetical protein
MSIIILNYIVSTECLLPLYGFTLLPTVYWGLMHVCTIPISHTNWAITITYQLKLPIITIKAGWTTEHFGNNFGCIWLHLIRLGIRVKPYKVKWEIPYLLPCARTVTYGRHGEYVTMKICHGGSAFEVYRKCLCIGI